MDRCGRVPLSQPTLEDHRIVLGTGIEQLAGRRRELGVGPRVDNQDWAQMTTSGVRSVAPRRYRDDPVASETLRATTQTPRRGVLLGSGQAEPLLEDGGSTLTRGESRAHRDGEPTAEPVSSPRRPIGLV
jgi:hypothetical protein